MEVRFSPLFESLFGRGVLGFSDRVYLYRGLFDIDWSCRFHPKIRNFIIQLVVK